MAKPVVLVTGGTSRTGGAVGALLLASGEFKLRMGARDSSKLASFVAQGAEAVEINSASLDSMRAALKGVSAVFFTYPPLTGGPGDALMANFFLAVKESHAVTHIVYLSTMRSAPGNEEFELVHKHYRNEQELIHSGVPFTILRPTYFHENLVTNYANSIKETGEYRTSAGDGVWTSVAISDVAAMAVAAIANPDAHAGKTYKLREEAVTHQQVAEKISRVIGKTVTMVNLTPEEHYELVMKSSSRAVADHVVRSDKEKRDGQFSEVTPDLEMVLGRPGVSLDAFLKEHADAFKPEH